MTAQTGQFELVRKRYQTIGELAKKFKANNKPIRAPGQRFGISRKSGPAQQSIATAQRQAPAGQIRLVADDGPTRLGAMAAREYYDRTVTSIAALGRNELKRQIKGFRGRFKLDFTEDYLDSLSVDRLRHILLAALVTAKRHN